MSDSELLIFVADGLRPDLNEHSVLTSRLYGIAKRLTDKSPIQQTASPARKRSVNNPFTAIAGGLSQQVPGEE